jgi:hypothetical protein
MPENSVKRIGCVVKFVSISLQRNRYPSLPRRPVLLLQVACCAGARFAYAILSFHRQRYPLPGQIHIQHLDRDPLSGFDHIGGIFRESVPKLADVHQPILMHSYIHECPEGRDIGHNAGKLHARL